MGTQTQTFRASGQGQQPRNASGPPIPAPAANSLATRFLTNSARRSESFTIVDPLDATRRKHIPQEAPWEDLLTPVLRHGQPVREKPALGSVRERVQRQLALLHPGIKRFENPHQYPAGLEAGLHNLKTRLVLAAKKEP